MSKSRHTEAQMVGAIKQVEAGRKAEDVAGSRREQAYSVLVESKIRWDGCQRGSGSKATAG